VPLFRYRASVREQLLRHGIDPLDSTPPELVRELVNDLYVFEIRKLRERFLGGNIPKHRYAKIVEDLRKQYPILSLPLSFWTEDD
jgi:hypothetical protein